MLSVCGITGSTGDHLESWILRLLEYADELVIMVDASSPSQTLETVRKYADIVELFEHPRTPEEVTDRALRRATGDWVLRIDDDEIMNRSFADRVHDLMADTELTHYMLPRRWVVRDGDRGGYSWIRQSPWYPDPCFRLIRNIGSLYHHPPRAHAHTEILGDGRLLADEEGCIYHMDLVWKTRREREDKVRLRYGAVSSYTAEEYYLYEGSVDVPDLVPIAPHELSEEPGQGALAEAARRATATAHFSPQVVSLDQLVSEAMARGNDEIFAAEMLSHQTPASLHVDRGYLCSLTMRNVSKGKWRCSGPTLGRVMISYHWLAEDGSPVSWDGRRSFLPRSVAPGQEVTVAAGLVTPAAPGRYILQWDLVCEGVSWFAEQGVRFPAARVQVGAAGEGA